MIYRPDHCDDIRAGRKTQTRRIEKRGEYPGLIVDGQILFVMTPGGRIKWQVGRTYAIQGGRGHKANGRTLLLGLRREALQDITVEDVEAEGVDIVRHLPSPLHPAAQKEGLPRFMAHHLFSELWDSINKRRGERWMDNPFVWVHEIQYVEGSDESGG